MKLIKKNGTVIMKAYDVEELESDTQSNIIQGFVDRSNGEFYQWSRNDVIEHIQANEYLFTKEGEMLPITYTVAPSGKIVAHKLKIAGEEVEVQIEDKGVKRIKQIIIDVELESSDAQTIKELKESLRQDIEFTIGQFVYANQVGDLRFINLTDEHNKMHKEDLN